MPHLFRILTFLILLSSGAGRVRAVCLIPSDHVLNLHGTVRNLHLYGNGPQQQAALADRFFEQGNNTGSDHGYYFCAKCNHVVYPRKREYLPLISREPRHAHYTSAVKDTLGLPYVLNCHFLI